MTIKLNHTIVYARDKRASSTFLAERFGLPAPVAFGPFLSLEVGNEVTLDFHDEEGEGTPQHDAFLVSEDEFGIFERIQASSTRFWLGFRPDRDDPDRQRSRVPVGLPLPRARPGLGHVHIQPATPRLNGKVETSHRIDSGELAPPRVHRQAGTAASIGSGDTRRWSVPSACITKIGRSSLPIAA